MRIRSKKEITGARLVFGYLGLFLMMVGIIELIPFALTVFYPDELSDGLHFLFAGLGGICVGFCLFLLIIGKQTGRLKGNQGLTVVLLTWLLAITMFAIPWATSGYMDFTRAFFECTSGFTTTGMTTCDIANTSHIFLFSRSLMTFTGGIGLVLILTSAMSNKAKASLYTLEGHNDKLLPNLAKSARTILLIYLGFAVVGSLAMWIAGIPLFDAVNTTMASLSTGGFSTNPASVAGYDNLAVEIICVIEMTLGATNFLFHYLILKGRFKEAFKNGEFVVGLIMLATIGTALVVSFWVQSGDFGLGVRYGLFHYFTSWTGAGFTNIPESLSTIRQLPSSIMVLTVILMVLGGQSGSTSGGVKQYRLADIWVSIKSGIKSQCVPSGTVFTDYTYKFGQRELVNGEQKKDSINYAIIYLAFGMFGAVCLSYSTAATDASFGECIFEFFSCLGTTGLSVGITSATASKATLWIEIIGMLFGRLELGILFIYIGRTLVSVRNLIARSKASKEEK